LLALIVVVIIAALSPFGLIFVVFAILQRFAIRRRWVYILGLCYEIFFCLLVLLVWLDTILISFDRFASLYRDTGFLGFTIGMLAVLAVAVPLTIKMFLHLKKIGCPS